MSRTITSYGGAPPSANRVLTFGSDWSQFDTTFPDRGFPWQYQGTGPSSYIDQPSGQQTTQNSEEQYYVKQSEILLPSDAPEWDNGKPWNVNDNGNMVLRGIKTPAAYVDKAYVVINGYEVVSSTSTEIRVRGTNYYDRPTATNRVGIDKHERSLYTAQPLRVKAGNTVYDINNIIDESGATDPTSGETFHRIQVNNLSGGQPVAGDFVNVLRPTEFISGMFTSRGTQSQKYGSWEMRAKFPSGRGGFPAIWSWPNYNEFYDDDPNVRIGFETGDKDVEIDFMECLGHAPDIWYHNAHQPAPYDTSLPSNGSGGRTMLDFVTHQGLTPFDSPAGWTGANIQQHQVLIDPSSPDYINGATDFITCRWDWYTDNTAAWFVKKDDWSDFRKVADLHMSPHSFNNVIDARCWFVNNAINGSFNFEQEINDAAYPRLVTTTPDTYDFEIDYLRTYQWENETSGGAGFPDKSGIYPTGFTPTPGNEVSTSTSTSTSAYVPEVENQILYKQGHTSGLFFFKLANDSEGYWDFSSYGSDAEAIGPIDEAELTLRVTGTVDVSTPRVVKFIVTPEDPPPSIIGATVGGAFSIAQNNPQVGSVSVGGAFSIS